MKNTIFYSWQSDLPNHSNRNFIQSCVKKAIKDLKSVGTFEFELNLDRDTKDEPGTPDIVDAIFKKIDRAKILIADISIINAPSDKRKTPNPNVLVELGYAAKSIGWERIICIYNTDWADVSDLPFDLRQRRPIFYSIANQGKETAKETVSKAIVASVRTLYERGVLFDVLNDYLKVQVDTEILTIINHLAKIIWGYSQPYSLERIKSFLNITDADLKQRLSANVFTGFQVFKKLALNERALRDIADKIISSAHLSKELAVAIINFIRWTESFENFNRARTTPNLFLPQNLGESNYTAVNGVSLNPKNLQTPDRFILLEKMDETHSRVVDFGDFVESDKIAGLTGRFVMNSNFIEPYAKQIRSFIQHAEKWLDSTNGEFIIDNAKMFEIRKQDYVNL